MRYQLASLFNGLLRICGLRTIQSQFAFSFALIIVFSGISVVSLNSTLSATADTVNMAGGQRMLSQRLAKEALLLTQDAEVKATLETTMQLFENSHQALMLGDSSSGINKPATEEIEQQLQKVWRLWLDYKIAILTLVNSKDSAQSLVIKDKSVIVLSEMNKAVAMMADEANSAMKVHQTLAFFLAFAVLFVAVVSSVFGLYWLMDQIRLLKQRLGALAQGDFTQVIGEDVSDNEVGQMFVAYNNVIDKIGTLVSDIKTHAVNISSQNSSLVESAESSEKNVSQQSQEIEMVASAVTEMSASVNEVAKHAAEASENVSSICREISQGQKVVATTKDQVSRLSDDLQSAVSVMQQLDEDSQHIGNVLTVITGIAEQTNLLALNAAIEAARAGEQGRGFAVVADEVRTLAQRTQESTEEIRKIIESLQSQTGKAVHVMEASTSAANESVDHIKKANQVLNDVVKAINGIQDSNAFIASAAQQQANVSNEVDKNVSNISMLFSDTKTLATDIRKVVQDIDMEVIDLNEAVSLLTVKN